jgi:hypothetical protein
VPSEPSGLAVRVSANDPALQSAILLACSGAKTAAVTRKWFKDEPPQVRQLRAHGVKSGLVTISVCGNDAGFAAVLHNCATHDCEKDGVLPAADRFIRTKLAARIVGTLKAVRSAAPTARVVLIIHDEGGPGTLCALSAR